MTEPELLGALLRSSSGSAAAVELARGLLRRFRGLRGLLSADASRTRKDSALTRPRFAQLQAALELARRHYQAQLELGPSLTSPRATRDFLIARLRDRPYEVFCCLYLDNRHRLTAFDELFRGTIDGASVHPREVVREALHHRAAAVIRRVRMQPCGCILP